MKSKRFILLVLAATLMCGGCTSTRYFTDQASIKRQNEMRSKRTGGNVGDVLVNFASVFASALLNTEYEVYSGERSFKKITVSNESNDSLYVNMVTDIKWKDSTYCDILGIALPAGARQKVLAPFPAAYNVYFRKPGSDEEKLEIRTDARLRVIRLKPGMTAGLEPLQNEEPAPESENN